MRGGATDLSPHGLDREALRRSGWSETKIAQLEATWEGWAEANDVPEVTSDTIADDSARDDLETWEVTEEVCGALSAEQCDSLLYGLDLSNRVYFDGVKPGSNREALGIKDGDVILTMNGEPIFSTRDFTWRSIEGRSITTRLVVDRAGEQITIIVPEGTLPSGRYQRLQVVPPPASL